MPLLMEMLEAHQDGETERKLSAELRDLVTQAQGSGKAAELTVKIVVKPSGYNQVKVEVTGTPKPPKQEADGWKFYTTKNGGLSNRDPEQLELKGLRVVGGGEGE